MALRRWGIWLQDEGYRSVSKHCEPNTQRRSVVPHKDETPYRRRCWNLRTRNPIHYTPTFIKCKSSRTGCETPTAVKKTTPIFMDDCGYNAGYFGLVHVAHRTQPFFEFVHFRFHLLLLSSWNCSNLVITSYLPCLNYKTLVGFSVGSPSPGLLLIHA
jgi:hypothetical protein